MNTFTPPPVDWAQLSPVIAVLGAAVLGVLLEAVLPRRARRVAQFVLAMVATAVAAGAVVWLWGALGDGGGWEVLGGSVLLDRPALFLQGVIAVLTFISLLVIADRTSAKEDAFAPRASAVPGSDYETLSVRKGLVQTEVFPLVLFASGGMMIFPATGNLLVMFIALEVLSLPLYLLTAMARRRRLLSQEASLKYFLLGAYASAFFLFGVALLYGFAGSVRLDEIAAAAAGSVVGMDGLLYAGVVLVLVGLLFKVGAVPFHSWTPDVYQGAPTPITGFMAACTKIAAFGAVLRITYVVLPPLQWDLRPVLWGVAILTMVTGTVLAIVQTDIKRMLAYSAIAHTGFVLTGVVAFDPRGISAVLFYLLAYGVSTIGAFAVVTLVRETDSGGAPAGEATHLTQWAGLGRRSPVLAVAFALFLLSFAGIPLTSGFVAKFAAFTAAVAGGATVLAVVGVAASAVAAFFYVRVIVLMFFTEPGTVAGSADTTVVRSEGGTAVVIALTAVATVLLGVLPSPVLNLVTDAAIFIP